METCGDGVGTEGSIALVGGAGTFRIEPRGCAGDDGDAVGAFTDPNAAVPAAFRALGGGYRARVEEVWGFLEILPRGRFAEGGFVECLHGLMEAEIVILNHEKHEIHERKRGRLGRGVAFCVRASITAFVYLGRIQLRPGKFAACPRYGSCVNKSGE